MVRRVAGFDGRPAGSAVDSILVEELPSDDKFLESNDTFGISWMVSLGGSMFDRIALTLTDAADVGAYMRIVVGDDSYVLNGLGNGESKIVEINFDSAVSVSR